VLAPTHSQPPRARHSWPFPGGACRACELAPTGGSRQAGCRVAHAPSFVDQPSRHERIKPRVCPAVEQRKNPGVDVTRGMDRRGREYVSAVSADIDAFLIVLPRTTADGFSMLHREINVPSARGDNDGGTRQWLLAGCSMQSLERRERLQAVEI